MSTQVSTKLKVGDEVVVIAGKNKQSRGKLVAIDREKGRVVVQGVNLRKRFTRPTQENPKGGQIEIEHPIAISNVMYYDSKAKKGSRIRITKDKSGARVRVAVASGKEID